MAATESEVRALHDGALSVLEHAYCPYSQFRVGAALLCDDGSIYTGCNVECASFPVGVCAERTAICKAVSEGRRKFKAILVVTRPCDKYPSPCGVCRQMMAEFGLEWEVILAKGGDAAMRRTTVRELLPHAFSLL